MRINTIISYGYESLIREFMIANELDVKLEMVNDGICPKLAIVYEDDSETATAISFLSTRNLGLNNMLCDYLQRCGVGLHMIPIGKAPVKLDQRKLDAEWEIYRKEVLGIK